MTITLEGSGYAPTAYRSNQRVPAPKEPDQQSTLFRKSWTMGAPLPTGKLSGVVPPGFLETWHPQRLREYEDMERRKGITELEERHTYHGRLDEECLRYATLPRVSWALLWMQHGGRLTFYMLFPIFVFVWLVMWFTEPKHVTFHEFFWDGIFPLLVYAFLPMLLG
jgi:hypothetical protein